MDGELEMVGLIQQLQKIIGSVGAFLASLSLRIYLAPIFIAWSTKGGTRSTR